MSYVLDIRDLKLGFKGYTGFTEVLHGISLNIRAGERVALVGESGSGKSVTARIVLGILQDIQRRAHKLLEQLSVEQFVEFAGVVGLANGICRRSLALCEN